MARCLASSGRRVEEGIMASLPTTFDRLVSTRHRTLEIIEKVAQETSDRRPSTAKKLLGEAGTWSIGEVLDHILRVYNSLVGEIEHLFVLDANGECTKVKRTLKDYDVAPALIPKSLMTIFEPGFRVANGVSNALLPSSLRQRLLQNRVIPIQNPTKWLPMSGRGIEELRSELISSLSVLENLLQRETQNPLEDLILSHTVYGSSSVVELLGLLDVHEAWHHEDLEALAGD